MEVLWEAYEFMEVLYEIPSLNFGPGSLRVHLLARAQSWNAR